MADKLLFVLTQKLAVLFVGGLGVLGGLLTMGSTPHGTLPVVPQTAIIANAASAVNPAGVVGVAAAVNSTTTIGSIDLLPTTTIPFCPANTTSTCGKKNIQILIRLSKKMSAASALVPLTVASQPTPQPTPAPAVAVPADATEQPLITSQTITTQSFLADTASSLKVLLNGLDELVFTTTIPGQTPITWGLAATTVGGTGSVPEFSITSSCNPAPLPAPAGTADQNPTFNVRTAYNCSVSLTPTSGTNRVTQSKAFSFTTPPGQLIVMSDPSMNTILVDNTNNGGIVFNNQDTNPITVTGITFDASYSYISTLSGPLVLRFVNPTTGASLIDYHLENIPVSATNSNTHSQSDITVPLSFTIPPLTQKMLPIEVLGVNRMSVIGTTPTITINVSSITTNTNDGVKEILNSPSVSWSCIVSSVSYDPNATSSPYATGQACLN